MRRKEEKVRKEKKWGKEKTGLTGVQRKKNNTQFLEDSGTSTSTITSSITFSISSTITSAVTSAMTSSITSPISSLSSQSHSVTSFISCHQPCTDSITRLLLSTRLGLSESYLAMNLLQELANIFSKMCLLE